MAARPITHDPDYELCRDWGIRQIRGGIKEAES